MNMVSMSPQCKFNSETPKGFIFSCFWGSLQLSRFFPHTAEHRKTKRVQNSDPQWVSWDYRWEAENCDLHQSLLLLALCLITVLATWTSQDSSATSVRDFLFRVGASLYNLSFGVYTLNGQPLFSRTLKNSSNTYSLQSGYNDLQFKNWMHRSCFVVVTALR